MEIFPVGILSVSNQSIYPHFLLLGLAQTFGLRSPIYSMMFSHLAFVELCLCEAHILAKTFQYCIYKMRRLIYFDEET